MKLAIMQPYFLPYIGYFQLIDAVDKFVIFDDVNYINRGWINRNRLLLNGSEHMFTIPLRGASQNKLICEIELADEGWRNKMLRTIQQAYSKAPCYEDASELMANIINAPVNRLDDFLFNSIKAVAGYLDIEAEIERTSRIYRNAHLKGEERILDICRQEHATVYVNPIGGTELYAKERFQEQGIQLSFLRPRPITYSQGKGEFVPWLSILDVLMFNERSAVRELLAERDVQ